ncbi:MAG: YfiR/HmsC family protein [Melioribacteraceae bacterium]
MRKLIQFLLISSVCCFQFTSQLSAQQIQRDKAVSAYIYNFAKNVLWQNEETIKDFHFLVIGNDRGIIQELNMLAKSQTLRKKPITLSSASTLVNTDKVQLVFVTKDADANLVQIFDKVEGKNILLVTDGYKDKRLIMINFIDTENGTLKFEINKANIINQRLKIMEEMILLGGTEVDVAALYREGQQSLRGLQKRTKELESDWARLNNSISEKTKEIVSHKDSLTSQKKKIQYQKDILVDQSQLLKERENALKEQQKIYDQKSQELEKQKEELRKGNETLSELKENANRQKEEIKSQTKILDEQGKTIHRQKNFLYLLIIIALLAVLLVAVGYHSYSTKKKLNKELETRVLERTEELNRANNLLNIELLERKQIQEVLKENVAKFQTLFDVNPDAIIISDAYTQEIYECNQIACEMNGYTHEELVGTNLNILHPKDIASKVRDKKEIELFLEELKKKRFVKMETIHKRKDGTHFPIETFICLLTLDDKLFVMGIDRDITERKLAEEKLRQSEEQFRLISENVADMIVVLDLDGKRIYSNPSYKPILGETGSLQGTDSFNDIHPDDRDKIKSVFQETIRTGKGNRAEYRLISQSGSIHYIESQGSVIRDEKGKIANVVVVSRDITSRKETEEELRKYRENLEEMVKERTTELEIAKEKAESADRLKSAFLATMSHELRTPLNSIIGFTGILMKGIAGQLNDEQLKQLGMAKGSAQHLLELINDVLDISKIEAGQLVVSLSEFDFNKMIHKVTSSVEPLAAKKKLDLKLAIPDDEIIINSDERRMSQVFLNLINNAIKFTDKGAVKIECNISEQKIITKVIDTGIGIKADDTTKLFKPFSQIDTGLTRNHDGTGLGLSISKKLVEKLGGTINVESEVGVGSTFTVTLPLT